MAGKRKRSADTGKGREGNPFDVPESSYHIGVLRAVEPFVTIWETEGSLQALGTKNKFFGGLIAKDTVDTVASLLWERLAVVESVYAKQRTEGNMRPWHLALVEMFYWMSTPSETELRDLKERLRMRGDMNGLQTVQHLQQLDDDALQGFAVEIGIMDTSSFSTGSEREGVTEANEDELGLPEHARTDIKFRTHKPCVFKDPKLSKRKKGQLKSELCPFIAECKANECDQAVFQNVGYGRVEVRHNIAHGHYDPVYLPIFGGSSYTYGVLDVHGLVEVSENTISPASYLRYTEHCDEKGVEPKSESDLIKSLDDGIAELELWNDYHPKRYPTNKYLVGDFYIAEKWYPLPTGNSSYSSPESHFFMEAMLRVVVGDKVLSWRPDDARRAFWRRNAFIKLQGRVSGAPEVEEEELSHLPNEKLQARMQRLLAEMVRRRDTVEPAEEQSNSWPTAAGFR
ncbi:uncharacterized protein LOC112344805 isoform X2 [Selaginella moellendorffii]|uniref:uncharacterized protein LOC112344805 isoform X2 n=1 Tax=Selaginella moellendorffii TaxID=88036 RepID=UPI000D1C9C00|nr:uncharacterized protein LOC112344805 isoform X2 [Selaginella moellendorffii]|eukprot:XP_024525937.1 uncharacterized protein LOC112344805 isoform X2 [Selaginella moellendorffii]